MSTLRVNSIQDLNGNVIISSTSLGQTSSNPASSATAIIQANPAAKDGLYWITMSSVARRTFCMFDTNGLGWILAARMQNGDVTWEFGNSKWTDTTVLNDTSLATDEVNIKTHAFNDFGITAFRMCGSVVGTNYSSNPLDFPNGGSFGGSTLRGLFNAGNNTYNNEISMGRAPWLDWVSQCTYARPESWDAQPNCNEDRINSVWGGQFAASARIGISMNNEGDCNTNDSCIGFGLVRTGVTGFGAGGIAWPQNDRYTCYGWLWVR
jgi:hypothetical protein